MHNGYVIITGAAGNIGNKLAYYLLNKGYRLILTSRNAKHLREMQEIFDEYTDKLLTRELDLADKHSIEHFVKSIKEIHVVGLVNNAATDNIDSLQDLTYESIQNISNVNYVGTAYLTTMLAKMAIEKRQGLNIVNVSSLLSVYGANKSAAYSASKAALEAFARNLTVEFADKDIVCNSVRVAAISGELNLFVAETHVVKYDGEPEKANKKNAIDHIPAKRCSTHREINELIEFLLSGKVSYMNGQCINLDGGTSIQYPGYSISE